jgi:hypothetical protein
MVRFAVLKRGVRKSGDYVREKEGKRCKELKWLG